MSRSQSAGVARHVVDASHASAGHKQLEARRGHNAGDGVTPAAVSNQAMGQALGGGAPIEPGVRAEMEQRFGTDFADVRIHDDQRAHRSAAELQANAFTRGNDIAFGAGRYAPAATEGRRLLAHELAHVVQQRRGGPAPALAAQAPHEAAADLAAAQVTAGRTAVSVQGGTGVGVARDVDDDQYGDAEKAERRGKRASDKRRTQTRSEERADARGGAQQSLDSKAKAELDSMMKQAKRGDFVRSSPDEKLESLHRFKAALKDAQMSQLAKNKLQGRYDELLRTPGSNLAGDPQSKWVAGGEATPDMDLPAGRSKYAQPEHSRYYNRAETLKRYHVNLKSDTLDGLSPSEARAKGRTYAQQAQRNARHLPEGEGIVLDFAEPGSPEVRDAICEGAFAKDGAIQEIRFHTRTVTRSAWEAEMGVGRPLDVDARAKKERLAKERQQARDAKAKADAAAKELREKLQAQAKQKGNEAREQHLKDAEAKRTQAGDPEPTSKKARAKLESDAKKAAKAAEQKFLDEAGLGKKAPAKPKRPGAKKANAPKQKTAKESVGKKAPKAKSKKTAADQSSEKAKGKTSEASKRESAKGTPEKTASAPEAKAPQAKAPEVKAPAAQPAAGDTAAPKTDTVAPKAESVAPKVEPVKPTVPLEVTPGAGVTPKEMVGGAMGAAGFLAGVAGVKDIIKDFQAGHPWSALGKAGMLGLSFVPEAAPPLFAFGTIMNYWGPRHEKIQQDSFDVGDAYADLAAEVPLLGRSETFRNVIGGLGAANMAVMESMAYTVKDMGSAVVEGAETLEGIGEDAYDWLTEGPSLFDMVEEMRRRGED